jgi:hypothetical protein
MKTYRQLLRLGAFILTAVLILFWCGLMASAQESSAPRVELLTMNGSKPNLSPAAEGITSYKIGDLYKRGSTRITLVKASEARFKIELPAGYSVFNNLIYSVDTDAVFTAPTDVTFQLPSAPTKEIFNKLRILYAQYDLADPTVPKWIDATLTDGNVDRVGRWLSEAEIRLRSRDFSTRTLHAVTQYEEPLVMVVALVDPTKVRELILLPSADHPEVGHDSKIAKLEVFASGVRICMEDSPQLGYGVECVWKPSPGKYKLQTVATEDVRWVNPTRLR